MDRKAKTGPSPVFAFHRFFVSLLIAEQIASITHEIIYKIIAGIVTELITDIHSHLYPQVIMGVAPICTSITIMGQVYLAHI